MFYVTSGITSGSDIDVLLLWHFEDETNKKVEGSPFQLSSRKPNDNVDNIFANRKPSRKKASIYAIIYLKLIG